MNLSLSVREYVFLVLLVVTPVAMWYLVFRPQSEATDMMVSDIRAKSAKLEQIDAARQIAVNNVKEDIEQLKQAVAMVDSRLPDAEQTGRMMEDIDTLAKINNLIMMQITPMSRQSPITEALKDRFESQWYEVELQGNFLGLYTFLQALENQPQRLIRIHSLSLGKLSAGRAKVEGDVTARLTLITFFRKPPSPDEPQTPKRPGIVAKDFRR